MRQEVSIRQDGPKVILGYRDRELIMSAASAREIANGLLFQAGKAEEIERQTQAVFDQAILYRAGASIGLLHNKHLNDQAASEAANNSKLRRYMRGGVKATKKFGAPSLISHPPRPAPKGDTNG